MELDEITFQHDGEVTEAEDVERCLNTLIRTPAGTCPLYRDFGISTDYLSMPTEAAKNRLALEIMDKAAKYEPRVTIKEVSFEGGEDGQIKLKVVITDA